MRLGLAAALALVSAAPAGAETVLSIGTTRVTAGSSIEFTLTITNPAGTVLAIQLDEEVHLQLQTPAAVTTLPFMPERGGAISVPPGGFAQVKLTGTLPRELTGMVTMVPTGIATNSVLLEVEAPSESDVPETRRFDSSNPLAGEGVLFDKPPPLAISAYEPTYIVFGDLGGMNAKFQLSLRYRLFKEQGPLAQRLPWIDDVYLAYSQTSLWDLGEASKPFKDSSYRPRLFYANYDLGRAFDGRVRLGVETGFGHESNGKEGSESRSFNMLYVRPVMLFGNPDGFRAYLAPLFHNYIADSENEDIGDYRGNVDWMLGIGSKGGLDFAATLRKGNRSTYGSAELDLRYPLGKLSNGALTGWLMLQYFGGYGESLLDYDVKLKSQLRLGIVVAQ